MSGRGDTPGGVPGGAGSARTWLDEIGHTVVAGPGRGSARSLEGPLMNTLAPTRRTLVKGAAWSLPVLAAASAVPARAVSCHPVESR